MKDQVQEIKSRLDIVEVVSEYVTLTPAGSNYKALSPFRSERTPSFMVSPELQIFKDFGGDKSGDVFSFIMEMEGVEFKDALRILAEKAGVKLESSSYHSANSKDNTTELLSIVNSAAKFYRAVLNHPEHGKVARAYLESRGVNRELEEVFELGFAPRSFRVLTPALLKKSYTIPNILKAGLAIEGKRSEIYDRFRGRIMIPIKDSLGRPIGFTGRILPEWDDGKMGKYVNSPQSIIFDKSRVLFGLSEAKLAIKQSQAVIIVEGQMDVILSHQAGIRHVVAVSGTALTKDHVKILMRYTKNFLLAFDNDEAGFMACKRSAELIGSAGGVVKVISIEGGKDVADLVREDPSLWASSIDKAQDFLDYLVMKHHKDLISHDVLRQRDATQELVTFVQAIEDPIIKNHYVQKISEALAMKQQNVYDLLAQSQSNENHKRSVSTPTKHLPKVKMSAQVRLQRTIIGYMLFNSGESDILHLEDYIFTQPALRSLYQTLTQLIQTHGSMNPKQALAQLSLEQASIFEEIFFEVSAIIEQNSLTPQDIQALTQEAVRLLRSHVKRSILRSLRTKLRQAKKDKDNTLVQDILQKIHSITVTLDNH